jgi:circadian clock protein KaiC
MAMETSMHDPISPLTQTPLGKLGSGVDGLDAVLEGGYPEGRSTMVKGGPGAGKTMLALQFLVHHASEGRAGIFVTFEESVEAVRVNAATLGWDLRALEARGLLFLYRARLDPAALTSGDFSLLGLMATLDGKARSMGAKLLVIDAIDILMRRFDNPARARDQLHLLTDWLDTNATTTLLSVKLSDDADTSTLPARLDYLVDCVVQLDHRVSDQISTRRLRVLKYRGSGFGSNEFPYVIGGGGISLVPIASPRLTHKPLGAPLSSGNEVLDTALSGGFRKSACVLVAGPSGSGKTTVACTFVAAACRRGERVLFVSFEESPAALASAVQSVGIDLQPAIAAGLLRLACSLPESTGADEHLFEHLQIIQSFRPDDVVIDAISACSRMGSGKAAFDYCMRLVNACKDRGITCLLVNQMRGSDLDEDLSGLGLTSLVDTVIQLRFEPIEDELQRSLLIRKARGCRHSPRLHEMRITDDGIVLTARSSSPTSVP